MSNLNKQAARAFEHTVGSGSVTSVEQSEWDGELVLTIKVKPHGLHPDSVSTPGSLAVAREG